MKFKYSICGMILLFLMLAPVDARSSEVKPAGTPSMKLYADVDGERRYFTGYDWMQFNTHQRFDLVEKARSGAVKLNAVMVLPAEVYVKELDRMFAQSENLRHMELGQAIQGLAIVLKDWDDGTDPDEKIKSMMKSTGPSAGTDAIARKK